MNRTTNRLALSILAVTLAISAAGIAFLVLARSAPFPKNAWAFRGFELIFALTFSVVGALVARNRPENAIGWLFGAVGLLASLQLVTEQYALYALFTRPHTLPGGAVAAWFQSWVWIVFVAGIGIYVFLLFPDGRPPSRRWRLVAWLGPFAIAYSITLAAITPGRLTANIPIRNPYGVSGLPANGASFMFVVGPTFALILISALSLVFRFRRSTGTQREQLKWIAFVGALLATTLPLSSAPAKPGHVHWQAILVIVAMACVPIAAGFAITRYRLYDIDRIISRTFSYAIVSAVLAGIFTLVVLVPTSVIGSGTKTSGWLVAAATLSVAGLFQPVRRRAQNIVDRRFNRSRYNTAQTIDSFAVRLRDQVDLDTLGDELRTIVEQTMQPRHVSMWIRDR